MARLQAAKGALAAPQRWVSAEEVDAGKELQHFSSSSRQVLPSEGQTKRRRCVVFKMPDDEVVEPQQRLHDLDDSAGALQMEAPKEATYCDVDMPCAVDLDVPCDVDMEPLPLREVAFAEEDAAKEPGDGGLEPAPEPFRQSRPSLQGYEEPRQSAHPGQLQSLYAWSWKRRDDDEKAEKPKRLVLHAAPDEPATMETDEVKEQTCGVERHSVSASANTPDNEGPSQPRQADAVPAAAAELVPAAVAVAVAANASPATTTSTDATIDVASFRPPPGLALEQPSAKAAEAPAGTPVPRASSEQGLRKNEPEAAEPDDRERHARDRLTSAEYFYIGDDASESGAAAEMEDFFGEMPGLTPSSRRYEGCCVHFRNVPAGVSERALVAVFQLAGEVKALRLRRRADGASMGQGLCLFATKETALQAVRTLHGRPIEEADGQGARGLLLRLHEAAVQADDLVVGATANGEPQGQQAPRRPVLAKATLTPKKAEAAKLTPKAAAEVLASPAVASSSKASKGRLSSQAARNPTKEEPPKGSPAAQDRQSPLKAASLLTSAAASSREEASKTAAGRPARGGQQRRSNAKLRGPALASRPSEKEGESGSVSDCSVDGGGTLAALEAAVSASADKNSKASSGGQSKQRKGRERVPNIVKVEDEDEDAQEARKTPTCDRGWRRPG
eukprot:TRINITY_DN12217_c0_g2_i1.p1 TRINITY_DN12217_c0_g2~~TRINITY_DN12217_c0_g2_i1.p1  ORF type:complete len:674 (-),score=188.60 TRINITY_DN12217_c0_g2_i1:104-2125(-)